MFKVVQNRTFTTKVSVMVPVDGGHDLQTFDCKFLVVPADEAEKHDLRTGEGTKEVLKLAVVGFGDDLIGEDEKPLPFSDKLRDALINDYPTRQGLIGAYLAAVTKARSGN